MKQHDKRSAPTDLRPKKGYTKPELKLYGKVAELTKGGNPSAQSDNGNNGMFT